MWRDTLLETYLFLKNICVCVDVDMRMEPKVITTFENGVSRLTHGLICYFTGLTRQLVRWLVPALTSSLLFPSSFDPLIHYYVCSEQILHNNVTPQQLVQMIVYFPLSIVRSLEVNVATSASTFSRVVTSVLVLIKPRIAHTFI